MNFGEVLHYLKNGYKVCREGWNGKGMWLVLIKAGEYNILGNDHVVAGIMESPFIAMKTVDNHIIPWVTSQADVLAEDWQLA
jgi:hypothetical protein